MIKRWLGRAAASSPTVPVEVDVVHEGPHSSEVYHDAARHFLDIQISTMDTLDTKLTQYLSVASFALPVVVALLNVAGAQHTPIPAAAHWMLFLALVCYSVVLSCAARASRIRALDYRPDIPTLKSNSEKVSGIYLKQWVANEYAASIAVNKVELGLKAKWVGVEAFAFYLEGLCLSIAAVLTVLL
jgi:hypothetical protein